MKTFTIIKNIIMGKKDIYYIGKKIVDIEDNQVGVVLNASVNKHYKKVYMDIEIDDIYDSPQVEINVNIRQNKQTKRYSLVLIERRVKKTYKKRGKDY